MKAAFQPKVDGQLRQQATAKGIFEGQDYKTCVKILPKWNILRKFPKIIMFKNVPEKLLHGYFYVLCIEFLVSCFWPGRNLLPGQIIIILKCQFIL